MKLLPFLLLLLLIVVGVAGISFNQNPSLSPTNATTQDVMICSWQPSADATTQNVTWWNGTTIYKTVTNISLATNESSLAAGVAKKNQNWTCMVVLYNGTATSVLNTSTIIANALPSAPNATNLTLYEDQTRLVQLSATDPDDDTITYAHLESDWYCSLNTGSGLLTCLPNATAIGTRNVTLYAKDATPTLVGIDVTHTIIGVNDPPAFSIAEQSATEGVLFNLTISATDEEENFPLLWSISSSLTSLMITAEGNATAYLSFNRSGNAPVYAETGAWNVTVTATDNGSGSTTPYDDNVTSVTFVLNITSVNHEPTILTNLSGLQGTQGSLFSVYLNATDQDTSDNLTFSIASNCSVSTPWSIVTINNSFNATGLINQTLTNDQVRCPWVTVTVSDGSVNVDETWMFNITNTNDPPVINEMSYYASNDWQNISNLSAVKGVVFTYHVNGTDPDQFTTYGDNLTYTDNTSLFVINSTTGQINFTPNESAVGSHYILINVSDAIGSYNESVLYINISNSSAPQLLTYANLSCDEDTLCEIFFEAIDPDPQENLSFSVDNETVINLTWYNVTSALSNFTPVNSQVGTHEINLSVTDQFSFIDWQMLNVTINNTNDAPFFDADRNGSADKILFGVVVELKQFSIMINATDDDYNIGLDNMTFNYSYLNDTGNLSANLTFSAGPDHVNVSFYPQVIHRGNHTINFSVQDMNGSIAYQLVNFTVLPRTQPPQFQEIRPYRNLTNTTTTPSYANATWFLNNRTSVNMTENTSLLFDARVTNDSTISQNAVSYYWYLNGSLNKTIVNATPGVNSVLNLSFSYFEAADYEVNLTVIDARLSSSSWIWNLSVEDLNRAPQFLSSLGNITINATTQIQDFFSYRNNNQRFYDADDDLNSDGVRSSAYGENTTLTYGFASGNENCTFASFTFSGDDITITPSQIGSCLVTFSATDPYNVSVESGDVTITVDNLDFQEVKVSVPTSSSGGGGSSSVPRVVPLPLDDPTEIPIPLDLIVPEEVTASPNGSLSIPVTVKNTWNKTLSDITLNANISADDFNGSLQFTIQNISSLEKDENVSTTLFVEGYRLDEPYQITITASVEDPVYNDSATVLINALEQTQFGTDVQTKVTFARDLLNDNPECQELNELIDRAEKARSQMRYEEALRIVDSVINGCKYLINHKKELTEERPKDFYSYLGYAQQHLFELVIGAVIVAVLVILSIVLVIGSHRKQQR